LRALVLTAGLGTRLQPLTLARAKAAAPVDGEPLARRTIAWLVSHGVHDLVLNLHHKPETITRTVGDGGDLGARVRYSWESPVLGSAGGPRHALPLVLDPPSPRSGFGEAGPSSPTRVGGARGSGDLPRPSRSAEAERTFVLVNGDTLTNVDLAAMLAQHRHSRALVTMALIPNPRPDKYGGVLLDAGHAITGFTRRGSAQQSHHFIGPQIVEAEVFETLPDGVPAESVTGVYPKLMAARAGSVMGYVSDATFRDIGTPADLLQTSLDLAAADGRPDAPWWGRNATVDPSARIARSVLWDDVTVGAGVTLTECIVADGVTVPDNAAYSRCAIVRDGDRLVVAKLD
jgi:NDP-sugar pyrophosphorylase family protein